MYQYFNGIVFLFNNDKVEVRHKNINKYKSKKSKGNDSQYLSTCESRFETDLKECRLPRKEAEKSLVK